MNAIVPLGDMERMAAVVSKSGLFGVKTPEAALSLMLVMQAEGRHPGEAIRDYHVVQNRPVLRSDAMLARFQAAGGRIEYTERSDQRVAAKFSHPQGGTVEVDWDQARAKAAGLLNRDNWKSYPRQMLNARVISEGVRAVFPGATSMMYVAEEVADMESAAPVPPKDVTPEPVARVILDEGERADHLAAIDCASDLADLKRAYATAYSAAKQAGDVAAMDDFEKAKDVRKAALTESA
jgi:hypothetical protein